MVVLIYRYSPEVSTAAVSVTKVISDCP